MKKVFLSILFALEFVLVFHIFIDVITSVASGVWTKPIFHSIALILIALFRNAIKVVDKTPVEAYPKLSQLSFQVNKGFAAGCLLLCIITFGVLYKYDVPNEELSIKAVEAMNNLYAFTDNSELTTIEGFRKYPVYYQWDWVETTDMVNSAVSVFTDVSSAITEMNATAPEDLDVSSIGAAFENYLKLVDSDSSELDHSVSNRHKTLAVSMLLALTCIIVYGIESFMYLAYIEVYEEVFYGYLHV